MPTLDLPTPGQAPNWGADLNEDIVQINTVVDKVTIRDTVTHTTSSLANNAQQKTTVTIEPAFHVYDVTVDRACRVRLYHTTTQRDADAARATGTYPTDTSADHGCFLEALFTGAGTYTITAPARVWLASGSAVPITVDNLSGSTSTVAVTFTYLPMEA